MFCFTFDNSRFISPEKTIEKTVDFRQDSKPNSFCPLFSPPLSTRVKPSGWRGGGGEGVRGMSRSRNLLKHLFHLHSTNDTGYGLGFVNEISPLKFKIWSRYDQEKYMIVTKKRNNAFFFIWRKTSMTRIAWHSRTRSEQGAFRLFKDK